MLIIFMMALHRGMNIKMLKQDSTRARILCQNKICLFKHLDGPKCHIVEIADRCRHYI